MNDKRTIGNLIWKNFYTLANGQKKILNLYLKHKKLVQTLS